MTDPHPRTLCHSAPELDIWPFAMRGEISANSIKNPCFFLCGFPSNGFSYHVHIVHICIYRYMNCMVFFLWKMFSLQIVNLHISQRGRCCRLCCCYTPCGWCKGLPCIDWSRIGPFTKPPSIRATGIMKPMKKIDHSCG